MTSDELIDGLERPARWWWSDHPKGQRKFVSTIPQQAADRIRELEAELDKVREYLFRLGTVIGERHYPDRHPEWQMHKDDIIMMCTQIDNMTSGMIRAAQPDASD